MDSLLIYIHGFNSSPRSQKAQEVGAYVQHQAPAIELAVPRLASYPLASYRQLQQLVESHLPRPTALIGSSLGGFMATALAQQYGLRAVLVNPAVRPYLLISAYLGHNENPYTGEQFFLNDGHMDELRQLEVTSITHPERLLVMVQTGDETLDYREAVSYYQHCPQVVEQGGSHRFDNFVNHLPDVFNFLELA